MPYTLSIRGRVSQQKGLQLEAQFTTLKRSTMVFVKAAKFWLDQNGCKLSGRLIFTRFFPLLFVPYFHIEL